MAQCQSCKARIIWAKSKNGMMPVDPTPTPNGNIELTKLDTDRPEAIVYGPDHEWGRRIPRFTSHFATCANAAQHRRKKA